MYGQILPLAVATVASPVVFIALFVALDVPRPVRNGYAFVLGIVAAAGVTLLASAFVLNGRVAADTAPDTGITWFNLLLGVAELIAGVWLYVTAKPAGQVEPPRIIERVRAMPLPAVFAVGVSVPTYPAIVSAGTLLLRSDEAAVDRGLGIGIYLLLCGLITAVPVMWIALGGDAAAHHLRAATDWLVQHSKTVGSAVLVATGIFLIVNSLSAWR